MFTCCARHALCEPLFAGQDVCVCPRPIPDSILLVHDMYDDTALFGPKMDDDTSTTTAFEALERDVVDVLSRLEADASMQRIHREHERLFLALKQSHQNERRLIDKCKNMGKELSQLQQRGEELSMEVNELRQDAREAREEHTRLKSDLEDTKESLSNVEIALGTATRREEELVNEIVCLQAEVSSLTQSLGDRTRYLEEVEAQREQDQEANLASATCTRQKVQEQAKTIEEQASTNAALEEVLETKKGMIGQLGEQLRVKTTDIQTAQEEVEYLRLKLAASVKSIAEKEDVEGRISHSDCGTAEAELPVDAQQNEITSLIEDVQSLENDIEIERSKASQLHTKNKFLETEHNRVKAELDAAKSELELRDLAIQKLTTKVIGTEKTAHEDKVQHERLSRENSNQKEDIDALRSKTMALEDEKRDMNRELELVKSRLTKIEEDAAAAEAAAATGAKCRSPLQKNQKISSPIRIPNNEKGGPMTPDELSRELVQTQHKLTKAECKAKALTLELESASPQNIHRWRKIESVDPDMWELIQKVANLQKRLIKKSDEASLKNDMIELQEKEIAELRCEISRHSAMAKEFDDVSAYQTTISKKDQELRSMAGELNMHSVIIEEMRQEIADLNRKLFNIKRLYFQEKKRTLLSECSSGDAEIVMPDRSAPGVGAHSPSCAAASAPSIRRSEATKTATISATSASSTPKCTKIDAGSYFTMRKRAG